MTSAVVQRAPSPPVSRRGSNLWRTDADAVDRIAGHAYQTRAERARRVLPAPVEVVFSSLFASDWMISAQAKTGNADAHATAWTRGDDGYMTRTVRFSRALRLRFGPKATRVVETQRFSFTSGGGVVVETSGHSLDVPFSEAFRVESYFEMSPVEDGGKTLIVASVAVLFFKNSIFRSRIENGALSETAVTYAALLDLAEMKVATEMAKGALEEREIEGKHVRSYSAPDRSPTRPPAPDSLDGEESLPSPKAVRNSPLVKKLAAEVPVLKLSETERLPTTPEEESAEAALSNILEDFETPDAVPLAKSALPVQDKALVAARPVQDKSSALRFGQGAESLVQVIVALLSAIALLLLLCVFFIYRLQVELRQLVQVQMQAQQAADACHTSYKSAAGLT